MYTDRPRPSLAYLAMIAGLTVLVLLLFVGNLLGGAPMEASVALSIPVVLMMALGCAAFFTRYRVEDGVLEARAWPMFRKRVPLSEIREVRRISKIGHVLGWAPGRAGCCNRFTDGLSLLLPHGELFISPEDVSGMEQVLSRHVVPVAHPAEERELISRRSLFWLALLFLSAAVLLVVLGIPMILGAVPPNLSYGVRTEETLSNDVTWYAANVRGGWCMLVAGMVQMTGVFVLYRLKARYSPVALLWAMIVLLLATTVAAGVLSLVLIP